MLATDSVVMPTDLHRFIVRTIAVCSDADCFDCMLGQRLQDAS